MSEKWIKIDWIPGLTSEYMISSSGNIKRTGFSHWTRGGMTYIKDERLLSPTDNGNGYKIVGLGVDGIRKNFYIHRLVAEAFLNNPDHLPEVNHIDGDRSNNAVDNLEWCTRKQNMEHAARDGRLCRRKPAAKAGEHGRGIRLRRGKYEVAIYHARKQIYVGRFETLEEAVKERDAKYSEVFA